jgi:alginate O-acetyltransferase complex protein AlgI
VWGTLHGVMLVVNHAWHAVRRAVGLAPRPSWRAARIAATGITFAFVVCTWVFFRAADVPTASTMLRSMSGLNGVPLSASAGAFWRNQTHQVRQLGRIASSIVGGAGATRSSGPARLAELNLSGPWMILLGVIVFGTPNTYELFARYEPALVDSKGALETLRHRLQWQPSTAWAMGLGFMFVASVLQLLKISPFLYFQF